MSKLCKTVRRSVSLRRAKSKDFPDATSPAKGRSESYTIINEKYSILPSDANHKVQDISKKTEFLGQKSSPLDFVLVIGGVAKLDQTHRKYSTYLDSKRFNKSGLAEEGKFQLGTVVKSYRSWGDYSQKTKGQGYLLKFKRK